MACNHPTNPVIELDNLQIYAGKPHEVARIAAKLGKPVVVHDLAGHLAKIVTEKPKEVVRVSHFKKGAPWRKFTARTPMVKVEAIVDVDWPDMNVPNLAPSWWHHAADLLREEGGVHIVACMGGHGRTGTWLAIMAELLGVVPKGESPIAWVRKVYCDRTVENDVQIAYIERVIGRNLPDKASKSFTPPPTSPITPVSTFGTPGGGYSAKTWNHSPAPAPAPAPAPVPAPAQKIAPKPRTDTLMTEVIGFTDVVALSARRGPTPFMEVELNDGVIVLEMGDDGAFYRPDAKEELNLEDDFYSMLADLWENLTEE